MNTADAIILAIKVALIIAGSVVLRLARIELCKGERLLAECKRRQASARRLRDQSQRIHDDTCRLIAKLRA